MKPTLLPLILFASLTWPLAAQSGATPPPAAPIGLAAPAYTGPTGLAGTGIDPQPHDGHAVPRPHEGPHARPHAPHTGGGGTAPGSTNVGGGSSASPARASSRAARGRGARSGRSFRRRGKQEAWPWLKHVHVPWKAAFLPVLQKPGYEGTPASISQALRLDPADGGWMHAAGPVLVFRFDSRRAEDRKALARLNADLRFKSSANLFTCFRVDLAGWNPRRSGPASVAVFDRHGALLAKTHGSVRIHDTREVLRRGYEAATGRDLVKVLARADRALDALAHAEAHIDWLMTRLIDARSGQINRNIAQSLTRTQHSASGWRLWLAQIVSSESSR